MYRNKLRAPTVETCPFRGDVRGEGDTEMATCRLLRTLLECRRGEWCEVRRDACDACCQSVPPSKENFNPVVASLVYDATQRILAAEPDGCDLSRMRPLHEQAARLLSLVSSEDEAPIVPRRSGLSRLPQLVPPPAKRHGRRVRSWAVGVTTAPRRQPTLEACLESLARAGWERPYLFVDSAVRVPDRFLHLPGTFRDEKIGAWSNYYLALSELLMRAPHADAYMILQDDVVLFDRRNLREYLEAAVLWPGRSAGLVSLYGSEVDSRPEPGWHRREGGWVSGAHALVFPPALARAFLMDPSVFGHRWGPDPVWSRCVVDVIENWTAAHRVDAWFPTPSLAQHVGDSSTLWPTARTQGSRRADRFAGDVG